MRFATVVIAAVAITAAAALPSAQSKPGAKPAGKKNPVAATAASIKAGQQVYNKQCRHCHGLRGRGDGPMAPKDPKPADLTDAKWDYGSTDGDLFTVIWNGVPKPKSEMVGMKDTLEEKDVWNVVNYVRSIGPKTATH
jgi:mono/diheme cytochrome c family protein